MSTDLTQEQPLDLREYLSVLRIRRTTVAVVALAVLAAVMAFSFRQTPMYTSTAKVWVKPIVAGAQLLQPGLPSTLSLDTERELVQSQKVADLAARKLKGTISGFELLKHVSVSVPSNSQILEISYSSPEPIQAQRAANALADSYIEFKRESSVNAANALAKTFEDQRQELLDQQQQLDYTIEHSRVGSPEYTAAESQKTSVSAQIGVLQSQIAAVNATNIDPGTVVGAGELPTSPSSPNHLLNAALGLLLGLALGVGLAFLRDRLDQRVRGRDDLEEHIGAPVLVAIPRYRMPHRRGRQDHLIAIEDPKGPVSEAYRTLRTSVQFLAGQHGVKTIMIVSAAAVEGKTTIAANLAVVLAQAGKRTVLLSADLRKPRLNRFFDSDWTATDRDRKRGLSSILVGDMTPQEALIQTSVENLWLIPSGPIPGRPAEVAGSDRMIRLLESFRASADFTIIDTAPALLVTDALAMAPHVDAVLYVASSDTERGTVARARVQLEQVGANVVGAVLNKFDPAKSSGYDYAYRYTYRYAPEDPEVGAGGEGRRRRPRRA